MAPVWTVDPELSVGRNEKMGPSDARVTRDDRTVIVGRRLSGVNDLQGDPSICDGFSSKPDSREAAKPQLMDDSVVTIVHITEVYRVEASRLIVLEVFAFPQLERLVLPRAAVRI